MTDDELLPLDASPLQVCASALGRLADFWEDVAKQCGGKPNSYFEAVFGGIWRDGDTGEKFETELREWEKQPPEMQPLGLLQAVFVATAYACQGMKADQAGDANLAWRFTARCEYWTGIVVGAWTVRRDQGQSIADFSRSGANARHAENRSMKRDVFAWLEHNMSSYRSKDAAARAIEGKVVPVVFRTARDWIDQWEKERPAGTP